MEGSIVTTFLIVFREALEASLIIGIILTVLARLNQRKYFPHVIVSTFVAILMSLWAGKLLMALTEAAQGNAEKLIDVLCWRISLHWAIHPGNRPIANKTVYMLVGKPRAPRVANSRSSCN